MGKFEKEIVELREQLKAVLSAHTELQEQFAILKNELERKDQIIAALKVAGRATRRMHHTPL